MKRYGVFNNKVFILVLVISIVFSPNPLQSASDVANPKKSNTTIIQKLKDFFLGSTTETLKQNQDEGRSIQLDPVTVIASRLPSFKTHLSNVPSNISYLSANATYKGKEQVEAAQTRTISDTIQDIEGGIFYDNAVGNGVNTEIGLRGFSESSSVIVLMDGIRLNEADGDAIYYSLVPMNDVESIQIDRGSASPIYGSGAFGGVVNITTRKPTPKLIHLFGGAELSSFLGIKFYQGVDGSIPDQWSPLGGRFTYYFNGGRDLNDGFRDNGEWRITNFDIKLGYELPEDSGGAHASVIHIDEALSNPGHITLAQFNQNPEQTLKPLDGHDFKNTLVQVGADKKFWDNKITVSLLANWRFNLIHFFTTGIQFADFPEGFNPDTDLVTTKSKATNLIWQLGYEDQWSWLGNNTSIGMEFQDESEYSIQQDAFRGTVVANVPRETDRNSRPDYGALFWRETVSFFDKVIVYAGMRHDLYRLLVHDNLSTSGSLTNYWNDSSASSGITLKPTDYTDLFFNYSQGFRVPSISEIAPFSGTLSTGLKPEKSNSYEVGSRLRYQDIAQAKFSYFLINVKDEIALDFSSVTNLAPFGQNVNLGESRRTGIETRFDVNPISELNTYGSFAWTKAYVREEGPVLSGGPVRGRSLGQVPQNRFTLGAILKPLYRLGEPYNGFLLSIAGTFVGKQHLSNYESMEQANLDAGGHYIKRYSVWNGMISFSWKGKQIYFKINNLFDEHYYSRAVAAQIFQDTVVPASRYLFVTPGAPREYLLGVKWEF